MDQFNLWFRNKHLPHSPVINPPNMIACLVHWRALAHLINCVGESKLSVKETSKKNYTINIDSMDTNSEYEVKVTVDKPIVSKQADSKRKYQSLSDAVKDRKEKLADKPSSIGVQNILDLMRSRQELHTQPSDVESAEMSKDGNSEEKNTSSVEAEIIVGVDSHSSETDNSSSTSETDMDSSSGTETVVEAPIGKSETEEHTSSETTGKGKKAKEELLLLKP